MTCNIERRTLTYCGRYGKHVKDAPVEITVSYWDDPIRETRWAAFCNHCGLVLAFTEEKDEAVHLAALHQVIDHPRDQVVFKVTDY